MMTNPGDRDDRHPKEAQRCVQGEGGADGDPRGRHGGGVGCQARCACEPDSRQIRAWKKTAQDGVAGLFEGDRKAARMENTDKEKLLELHAKIGGLTMERDFFR